MIQSSITSFFKQDVTPYKVERPVPNGTDPDESDEEIRAPDKTKRLRIVSSSEEESPVKSKSPKKQKVSLITKSSPRVKIEKLSPSKKKTSIDNSTSAIANERSIKKELNESPVKTSDDNETVEMKTPVEIKQESKPSTHPFFGSGGSNKSNGAKDEKPNGENYNPAKEKYHPINDAFWSANEKMPYLALAKTFEAIEASPGRLKSIEILSNLFRSVIAINPNDLLACVYLSLNQLAPAYEGIELGLAETSLIKVIGQTTGRSVAQIKTDLQKCGDLGIIAEKSRSNQRMMFKPSALTVDGVFSKLKEIAKMSGSSAMTKKIDKIQSMFVACKSIEARFLIRSLLGKLRIGMAEQSLLQALAQACFLTPPSKETPPTILNAGAKMTETAIKAKVDEYTLQIKTAFCECPTYDKIIPAILQHGFDNLSKHCKMGPGIPLKPMLAHPTKGVSEVFERFENQKFTCEWKYDGERAQIHICEDGSIRVFSRNQEENTSKYPDIIARVSKLLKPSVKSCIIDSEAVAFDQEKKQILPFQILSTRKRKDANEADIKVQVCVYMFDLLYLNDEPLVTKPFIERRKLLYDNFNEVEGEWKFATALDTADIDELQNFLDQSVKGNCEGLMVKTLENDATYEIAKRSRKWLKLKKDYISGVGDSLDLVVMGGFKGRGKRTGTYGGFLLGCYCSENEEYQSICKIGTGFSDEDLQTHSEFFKPHIIAHPKSYYRYDSSHEPDEWFEPVQVWEVKCADLSLSPVHQAAYGMVEGGKGLSLRFPRFIRIRDDKSVEDATSAEQVVDMYSSQDQIKNQQGTKRADDDEFY